MPPEPENEKEPVGGEQSPPTPVPSSTPALPLSANLVDQPAPVASDAAAAAERKWWIQILWSREHAEVASLYLDVMLRLVMSCVFAWLCWKWLDRVCGIVEKQTEDNKKVLTDTVLVALLTTTTVNVLGLLYFVASYLFPKLKNDGRPTAPTPPV